MGRDRETPTLSINDDELHDEHAVVRPEFVDRVEDALDAEDAEKIADLLSELHPADIADILAFLSVSHRAALIASLDTDVLPDVLSELDDELREAALELLAPRQIAEAISELESDDAAMLVEDLEADKRAEVLAAVDPEDRAALENALSFDEDTAGRLMRREVFAAPSYWTVGQTIDHLRLAGEDLPDQFYEIYVVDPTFHPLGAVAASRILKNKRSTTLVEIMDEDAEPVNVHAPVEDVAYRFEKYHLFAVAVTDDDGRLVGQITVDDIVDVIQEQNRADILSLGGVSDAGRDPSIWRMTKARVWWLSVNLLTALLAAWVISRFEDTITRIAILAALAPIVAGMGGNAGTQTATVVVRALATKELTASNAVRTVAREAAVGCLNGVIFAVLAAGVVWLWVGDGKLSLVIALAMVANLVAASLAGALIPIGLEKSKIDPAVASTVFLTTVTDVVGFFAFLGLATLLLL
jgi:magnesium transporter